MEHHGLDGSIYLVPIHKPLEPFLLQEGIYFIPMIPLNFYRVRESLAASGATFFKRCEQCVCVAGQIAQDGDRFSSCTSFEKDRIAAFSGLGDMEARTRFIRRRFFGRRQGRYGILSKILRRRFTKLGEWVRH